jgi:hypothetical protein
VRTRSYRTAECRRKPRSPEAIGGAEPCAIPLCAEYAVETLLLLVNGTDSMLLVCQTHAEWLGRYIGAGGFRRAAPPARGKAAFLRRIRQLSTARTLIYTTAGTAL